MKFQVNKLHFSDVYDDDDDDDDDSDAFACFTYILTYLHLVHSPSFCQSNQFIPTSLACHINLLHCFSLCLIHTEYSSSVYFTTFIY